MVVQREPHGHMGARGMLDRVRQALADDPVGVVLDLGRQLTRRAAAC